jgi:ATP-dependent Zn protease
MNAYQRGLWQRGLVDADRRREEKRRDRAISTAQHEAGHALVGLLLGLTPRSVTIEPGFDSEGMTRIGNKGTSAFDRCIFSMAGSESERLFGSRDDGHQDDLMQARIQAGAISEDVDDVERARVVARSILKSNFAALTALAVELLAARSLDRSEIEEIIAAAPLPDVDGDDDDDAERSDDGMISLEESMKSRAGGRRLVYYYGE